ncbi:MAG: isochorismatase family protein [Myxococcales bacterium]|nr:isochorismatase family protein [Myxococcales bacterium]
MALFIVDFQERLAAAMPEPEREACERNVLLLIELAHRQGWPILVSEQYPKGLGTTVSPVASALAAKPELVSKLEKLHFAATDAPEFEQVFAGIKRARWVVTGMETHVCVYQTVRGLLARGRHVHVPEDAVLSRRLGHRARGLGMIQELGGVVTITETVIFDALKVAGTDDFKSLSKRLR